MHPMALENPPRWKPALVSEESSPILTALPDDALVAFERAFGDEYDEAFGSPVAVAKRDLP